MYDVSLFMGGGVMDELVNDPDDPVVEEKDVPSYHILARKIKEIDNTIIIYRIFYFFSSRSYRFQLIKKNKMCMIDLPRDILENLSHDGNSAERDMYQIVLTNIENEDCWKDIQH